jgi:hypothetical protein
VSRPCRTPEEAARGDIPERFARALNVCLSPSGDYAVVLLETNNPPAVERYQVVCRREGGRWRGLAGGNGAGETRIEGGWVETFWEERPGGSTALEVKWRSGE